METKRRGRPREGYKDAAMDAGRGRGQVRSGGNGARGRRGGLGRMCLCGPLSPFHPVAERGSKIRGAIFGCYTVNHADLLPHLA
jgi:hypothetical protein